MRNLRRRLFAIAVLVLAVGAFPAAALITSPPNTDTAQPGCGFGWGHGQCRPGGPGQGYGPAGYGPGWGGPGGGWGGPGYGYGGGGYGYGGGPGGCITGPLGFISLCL